MTSSNTKQNSNVQPTSEPQNQNNKQTEQKQATNTHSMKSMSKSLFPKLLKMIGGKVLPQKCPVHHVHLVRIKDFDTNKYINMCPIRYINLMSAYMDKDSTHQYQNMLNQPQNRKFKADSNFLYTHSITTDHFALQETFKNFKTVSKRNGILSKAQIAKIKATTGTWHTQNGINYHLGVMKNKCEKIAKKYCNDTPYNYFNTVLTGMPGRGKTHLAMSILQYVNKHIKYRTYNSRTHHYPRCLFVNTDDLMNKLKFLFTQPSGNVAIQKIVDTLSNVYLLVLDDFGSENLKTKLRNGNGIVVTDVRNPTAYQQSMTYVQSILYTVLNSRIRTIFTTNEPLNKLYQDYDAKIVSRIMENTTGHIIRFPYWLPDYRKHC